MAPISNASRLAEFGSGIGTDGAVIQVDNINKRVGIGTTNPQGMLQVGQGVTVYGSTGIVSATSYYGDGSNLDGLVSAAVTQYIAADSITSSGIVTITDTTESTSSTTGALIISGGVGIAKSLRVGTELHVGSNVTIGGTLTYEDVTNVDSVGLVTARSGVNVSGGQLLVGSGVTIGNAGVATFSGTSDVHLLDNVKLLSGDGSDLQLYHNGSASFINNSTGNLSVQSSGNIWIENQAGSKVYIKALADAATEIYYNNSKKWETTNDGTVTTGIGTFTGKIDAQGYINLAQKIVHTGDSDTSIEFDTNTIKFETGGGERVRVDSSGRLLVGATGDDNGTGALIQAAATAGTAAFSANRYTNTADGPSRLYLFKSRATSIGGQTIVQAGDHVGEIVFHASDGTDATQAALIRVEVDGTPGNNDMPGALTIHTTSDGNAAPTERVRVSSAGSFGLGTTSPDYNMEIVGANPVLTIRDTETSQGSANARLRLAETGSSDVLDNYWDVAIDGQELKIIEGNLTTSTADTRLTIATDGSATFAASVSDSKGDLRRIIYQNKTSGYTLVASDAGKAIHISTGGVTIDNSIFSAGDAVTIVNNSGSSQTITQGSGVTLYNTGDDGSTGNKTLKGRGICTVWFSSASVGYISGDFE